MMAAVGLASRPSTSRAYNLAFADGSTIGVNDGTILVSLKERHAPTAEYVRKLREALPAAFPENMFYFQAADIVTQILNFGLPAQIDVRTVGYDRRTNLRVAKELQRRIAAIPGIADDASSAVAMTGALSPQPLPGATIPANSSFSPSVMNGTCNPATSAQNAAEFLGNTVAPIPGLATITGPSYRTLRFRPPPRKLANRA